MTVAPPTLLALVETFAARPDRPKSYVLDGIVGDARHMNPPSGYHVSYDDLGGDCSKYGLAFLDDCAAGRSHPTYASAWDLGLSDADMLTVTTRLINAAKANDPRVQMLWEIAGTTNGSNVHAYYLNSHTDDPTNSQGWDSSHMHHVHLSFRRAQVTDAAALAPLLDVICGVPLHSIPTAEQEFDPMSMTPEEFAKALWNTPVPDLTQPVGHQAAKPLGEWVCIAARNSQAELGAEAAEKPAAS